MFSPNFSQNSPAIIFACNLKTNSGNEIPKLVADAEQLYKDQKFEESLSLYEQLVGIDSGNPKIIAGLLRCLIQLKRFDDAKEMFESFDKSIIENEEISKIRKLLDSSNDKNGNFSNEKLIKEVIANPQDKGLRYKLAESYLSTNEIKKAFDELLKIFEQDPNWNESAAKKKLLEFFDILGFNDPNVIEARKKLSSMMFK